MSLMPGAGRKIVVAGAGSVGCYVGAVLAAAGRDVTLLVRPERGNHIAQRGIRVSDLEGFNKLVTVAQLGLTTMASAALAGADIVLVAVKSGDTASIAADIARHAPPSANVLSLQNGIGNAGVLSPLIAPRAALPGVVMFNVVLSERDAEMPLIVHRATSGGILMPEGHAALREALNVSGLEVIAKPDMAGVAWGKLLLNLNNAINALSGLPLTRQLALREWRRILADQTAEALRVMRSAGIKPAKVGAVRPALVPYLLQLPDKIFHVVAAQMLAMDPDARSSMWEDLERRHVTEIDYLQGEIARLAEARHIEVPVTARLIALVKAAEAAKAGSPRLTPQQVRGG